MFEGGASGSSSTLGAKGSIFEGLGEKKVNIFDAPSAPPGTCVCRLCQL